MPSAYLVAAARTPIGRFLGAFKETPAPQLAAPTLAACLARAGLPPDAVDEVILGQVLSAGVGQAPARQAALAAGLPPTISAYSVNQVCGSGLRAVMLAAQSIQAGMSRVVLAGGMENMSRAPHLVTSAREGLRLGHFSTQDSLLLDGLWCAAGQCHMGEHAEFTAREAGLTRAAQDAFAATSQERAAHAWQASAFASELVPIPVKTRTGPQSIAVDECLRADTTSQGLAGLKPAFLPEGTVTAGNSSTLADGAAAVLLVDEATARGLNTPWRARIVAMATAGTEPRRLFFAPIAAVGKLLDQTGLKSDQIDLFEINEAFASQALAGIAGLRLDPDRVNVWGGAIALGHPIGASGARVLCTLLSALHARQQRLGIATLCLGGGNAVALLVERET